MKRTATILASLLAIATCVCIGRGPAGALADDRLPAALTGDTEIEQLTNAYHDAQAELQAVDERIAELQREIDELEAVLPAQQARSDAAIRQRYIMQSNPLSLVESLLSAQTLGDFIRETDYLNMISEANLREFNRTREMKEAVDRAKAEQERLRGEAEARVQRAQDELKPLQEERAQRQSDGVISAAGQARSQGGSASVGVAADGGQQAEDYREAATTDESGLYDQADWHADRDEFTAEWAPRIDAYLEGSPLEGQGVNFAASAWKYNVDPRWSPAISNTESSKGAHCIRPFNAWGWGAADSDPYNLAAEWSSWEEAIDTHVKGLSDGYGYTISIGNAKKYCPPTWQSWYNHTLGEMERI